MKQLIRIWCRGVQAGFIIEIQSDSWRPLDPLKYQRIGITASDLCRGGYLLPVALNSAANILKEPDFPVQ